MEKLKCPYCGEIQYTHEPDAISSDYVITECENCELQFKYSVTVNRDYDVGFVSPQPLTPEWLYKWAQITGAQDKPITFDPWDEDRLLCGPTIGETSDAYVYEGRIHIKPYRTNNNQEECND